MARGKVITNGDLKPVPPAAPAAAAPEAGTTLTPPPALDKPDAPASEPTPGAAVGESTPPATTNAADDKKQEAYWRKRVATTRESLARAQTLQDALQARIAALATDFVNRDDPAQRSQVVLNRQKALSELERNKREVLQYQTDLSTTIPDEARRAGVPAGWVR